MPDTAPQAWARGKTVEEVLNITAPLVENFQRYVTPSPTPAPAAPASYDADGYVTGKDLSAALAHAVQQARPEIQSGVELASSVAYGLVQQRYPKEFTKYGPEIQAMLVQVPRTAWSLDNLERVVKIVRADHFDDYRAEWQTEVAAKMEPTMRSGGAAGTVPVPADTTNSLESEKIPGEWKLRAQKAGLTEATVREFCAVNDMTEAAFYKQFDTPTNAIVAEVPSGR